MCLYSHDISASTCINLHTDLLVLPVLISYGHWYEDICWCLIIIVINHLWFDETDGANHTDMVGRGVSDTAIFNDIDSHCGHIWFSTNMLYSRFLVSTYHLIMSLLLAESTLLISCWAFLSLLMDSLSIFPNLSLFSWFWGLPLWKSCFFLLLCWVLSLPGPCPCL